MIDSRRRLMKGWSFRPRFIACAAVVAGCLCGVVFAGGQVRAADADKPASIGINFIGTKPEKGTLSAATVAGVPAVAQSNWNNTTITNDDPNGHGNSGILATLKDSAGKEVKDASVSVAPPAGSGIWPSDGMAWGFTGGDETLHLGSVWPKAAITVKGVPYAKYAVYVYVTAGPNGSPCSATISVPKGDTGTVDPTDTYFCNFNWQGGNYVKAEAKTLDEAKASNGANYICFTGNTAKNVTVDFNGALAGWICVAAVQIVQTP